MFISKTHGNYSRYKPITIINRKAYENITLFHYNGCYHILFKLMVNIIHKKHWRSLFKSPKENIIYKITYGKNYEKLYNLLFKAHGN